MFGLFTPITYNTDLNPIIAHYYSGFCGGNCPSYASLFNPAWMYNGGIGMRNPYFNGYQCNNYYPNIFALNYSAPLYYGGGGGYTLSTPYIQYPQVGQNFPKQYTDSFVTNPSPAKLAIPVRTASTTQAAKTEQKKQSTKPAPNRAEQKVDIGKEFIKTAKKYYNCTEMDGSHRKFCINDDCKFEDPFDEEWCTDFVTYVVKESYKKLGKTPPEGFGDHDVERMKKWAKSNGYFINTSNIAQKGKYISENIKPGDIIVLNENEASHIGFVTKIENNGVIRTIEGNRDDRVKEHSYSPDYPDISGFIRLTF